MTAQAVLNWIAMCALCGGVIFWVMTVLCMFRMVGHRKPGVPLFPNWYESPFNIMFRPSQLTDTGLKARRGVFVGFFGFIGSWAVGFAAGTLATRWG